MIKILYHLKKNRKKIYFLIFLFILIFTSSYFTNILIEKPNNSLSNEYLQNNNKSRIASDDLIPSGERVTVMNDPRTTTVISWNTKEYPSEPIISYGETESLGIFKEASIYTIQTGYLCSAELTDLKPNTSYYYQVESNSSYKGEIMNFKTAPERNDPTVRFLVWGDSRTDRNTRTILAQKASQLKNFSFTIHTGDIVEDGTIQEQWDNYFNDTKKMNAFHQSYFIA
ncbi:MAG: metallophosphoesterase family protein, partial [Candidatus Lokiarchaeota archaeon]|nr:metallophosphoesterase family protein [Candidatus Lokiarchaeota archaeon]